MSDALKAQLASAYRSLLEERTNTALVLVPHKSGAKAAIKSMIWVEFKDEIEQASRVPTVAEIVATLETLIARFPHVGPDQKTGPVNLTEQGVQAKVRQAIAAAFGVSS